MRHVRRLRLGRWAVAHFTAFPAAVGAASGLEEGDKSSKRGYYAFIEALPKPPASECEQIAIPGHEAVGLAQKRSAVFDVIANPNAVTVITSKA